MKRQYYGYTREYFNSITFHYISMYIVIVNAKLKIIGINTGITQV